MDEQTAKNICVAVSQFWGSNSPEYVAILALLSAERANHIVEANEKVVYAPLKYHDQEPDWENPAPMYPPWHERAQESAGVRLTDERMREIAVEIFGIDYDRIDARFTNYAKAILAANKESK